MLQKEFKKNSKQSIEEAKMLQSQDPSDDKIALASKSAQKTSEIRLANDKVTKMKTEIENLQSNLQNQEGKIVKTKSETRTQQTFLAKQKDEQVKQLTDQLLATQHKIQKYDALQRRNTDLVKAQIELQSTI